MLTRQERQEIAERAKACKKEEELDWDQFSYVLLGVPRWRNDEELLDRIAKLCDTSNMAERPLDKDGEVIHIGDMVTNVAEGKIYRVIGYEFRFDGCSILLSADRSHVWTYSRPDVLIHKEPETIASLAEHLRDILQTVEGMDDSSYRELSELADNLEILGNSDD